MAEFAAHGANQEEKMAAEKAKKTIVIGHKNPDTDSICSAIGYANFKTLQTGGEYVPCRAGELNPETTFVLDYFKVDVPKLIKSVKTQVKDIEIRETPGVSKNISLRKAWNLMQEDGLVTLPAVTDKNILEGLITVGDITRSYMNVYDSSILSKACTQYANIIETLEGAIFVGDEKEYFDKGKVLIAAANPDMMEYYIEENDLVILGNRYESQLCAIEMGASCIIVCEGAGVSMTIKKLAQERGCTVITTPYDTYTAARLINQSMPIKHFMTKKGIIHFDLDDYVDEVRETVANIRHRDFPVLDENQNYVGMFSRRNLMKAEKKKLILVDHNEKSQAVSNIDEAEILEIIDHHRLGSLETMSPVYFRNQPLGCTSTIIYQMYLEKGITITSQMAGLMCAAILSDTLMFRSPTCTQMDEHTCRKLAKIANIDIEAYAIAMFNAGSKLMNETDEEIFYQDYKVFSSENLKFGIGQITAFNSTMLDAVKPRILKYMESIYNQSEADMLFFMLTNIFKESTELLYYGKNSEELLEKAFKLDEVSGGSINLPGVVSRKKQILPMIVSASNNM